MWSFLSSAFKKLIETHRHVSMGKLNYEMTAYRVSSVAKIASKETISVPDIAPVHIRHVRLS